MWKADRAENREMSSIVSIVQTRRRLTPLSCVFFLWLCLMSLVVPSIGEKADDSGKGPELLGDIDGSGNVDTEDKSLVEKAIGANSSDPDWDSRCDLDGDGLITFKDLLILESNMGKSLPGVAIGAGYHACGCPELVFAPKLLFGGLSSASDARGEVKLEFCVGQDGVVLSVRALLSDLGPIATKTLLFYASGWYFETVADSAKKGTSYSIITMKCQDLIGQDGGLLPG